MVVDGVTLPALPDEFYQYSHGVIIKLVSSDDTGELTEGYTAIAGNGECVHVPGELADTEGYDVLFFMGDTAAAWDFVSSETGWEYMGASTEMALEDRVYPLMNVMGFGIFLVWSNHYIMTVTDANAETGEMTVGDEVYFAPAEHPGLPEYSVPSNGILAAANLLRLLGPKTKLTVDDMYDFMESDACGWMEKMIMPGLTQDSLAFLSGMSKPITIPAEKIEIFPFNLFMLYTKFNLPNATEIGYAAFAYNMVSEFTAPKLQKIGMSALQNCRLETVDFPLVTDIGEGAFFGSDDMTSASFPVVERIGAGAFESCTGLASFTIPATAKYLGKSGEEGNPFPGCTALATVTVDSGNENYCVVNNREVYSKDMTVLVSPAIGAESYAVMEGVKAIAREAFSRDTALKSISLPSTLEAIGQEAFGYCTALEKLDIPATVTEIGYNILTSCEAMTTLILRKSDAIYEDLIYFMKMNPNDGTGYTYVPSALLETYKASENHSTYAAQFRAIEDYPDICG